MRYGPYDPQQPPNPFDQIDWKKLSRYARLLPVIVGVLLIVYVLSGVFYTVEADSKAVVLTLGKYSRTTKSGLHLRLPWPLEEVVSVPVNRIQSMEFGFRTVKAGQVTQYAPQTEEMKKVSRMLTADLNLCIVQWVVQYRIDEDAPQNYLFEVDDVENLIRNVSESVMRAVVGDSSIDEVITDRDRIASEVQDRMQEILDEYSCAVDLMTCKLQASTPPDEVKSAFDEVNEAQQRKQKIINEAKGERNRLIPAARGERDRMIAEAEGYRSRVIREASGEVSAFLSRLAEYEKAPEVTRERLYLETMQDLLQQTDRKIIVDSDLKGLLPLLQLETGPGEEKPK